MIKRLIIIFLLFLFLEIVNIAGADQVTLVANSTGVSGQKAQLLSDTCCDTENQITSANLGTPSTLTSTELNSLSSNDSTTSEVTQAGSNSKDERININYTLSNVQSVNYIRVTVMLRRTGSNDGTRIGIWNYSTNLYQGIHTLTGSTTYQAFIYNISGADLTPFTQLNSGILNFSVVGWGYGGSLDTIATTYFEAVVDYTPIPPDTSFTVSLPNGEAQAWFNATAKSSTNVAARSQTDSVGFLQITNTGNAAEKFFINITTATPSGVTLKADTDNDQTGSTTITTTLTQIIANLAISGTQYVWLWADYSNAVPMNVQRTLTTNSSTI